MLMSVQKEKNVAESVVSEAHAGDSVYASLFEKINLSPVSALSALDIWQDPQAMSEASADERLTAGMQVFMECLAKAGTQVEKLDKALIDHHIAELDYQISRQLDAVLHHPEFQKVESLWRGVKSLVDKTDFRRNVKIELLDLSKDDLRQDFEDAPEIIQSGLYLQTYVAEYDTPGGEPIAALVSAWEFDASAQDVALLKNISRVAASAHMPFIGSVGPAFFQKETMEEVAAIKDIGNHFERAEYIKWNAFRETDDARYIGLVMPRVLGRLPYGPDTVPVRSFNYVEEVKGPDHHKYLWTNASFAFAANMVRSFVTNGWCVQIRGPQAGGAVQDLPIHLYDLGTGNQVKIPSEVMIPETREFEFANLGFIPLSYYKNRDYACFFSANSAQKPALYDTPDATANSRINARLVGVFLLLAMLASFMNNQRLVRSVGEHLTAWHRMRGYSSESKTTALQRLQADSQLLNDWQQRGVPQRYGLGLYQGMWLIPPVERAISEWVAPLPPRPVIQKVTQTPKTVRLNSLALFDAGKWTLKPGATKWLVNALVDIKAKAGWLIVVSGHTDNTGDPQRNQALSLKRAEAVRDWMRDTGDIPQSCFAVQGYGESRPVAPNDTAEGRARNRRVEISLVPQADACRLPDASPAPEEGASENITE